MLRFQDGKYTEDQGSYLRDDMDAEGGGLMLLRCDREKRREEHRCEELSLDDALNDIARAQETLWPTSYLPK